MTVYAIVSAPREQRDLLMENFPARDADVIAGAERIYILCRVPRREADVTFSDPFDGALLVDLHYFDDQISARQWAMADDALRAARSGSVQ